MNTLDINKILRKYNQFRGTYSRNLLPNKINKPFGIVINTDPSSEPGEHWVAIYMSTEGELEYFDSFGLPPLHAEIIEFLDNNCVNGWSYNTITFQSIYSTTCGMYCVIYLYFKCTGKSFYDFTALFNYNETINDKIAKILYKGV